MQIKALIFVTVFTLLISPLGAQSRRSQASKPAATPPPASVTKALKNSWRGLAPLTSSAADVVRVLELDTEPSEGMADGPFRVEGGEVTFSYITPSLAKLYRAPKSLIGKIFTIYFKPDEAIFKTDLNLTREFKSCSEDLDRTSYYLVNDVGVVYQLQRRTDQVEMVIYQPSRAQIKLLAVNTTCVF